MFAAVAPIAAGVTRSLSQLMSHCRRRGGRARSFGRNRATTAGLFKSDQDVFGGARDR